LDYLLAKISFGQQPVKTRPQNPDGDPDVFGHNGIGAKLLDRENLAAELTGRNYSAESIGKNSGKCFPKVSKLRIQTHACPSRPSVLFAAG
jgi:hypothetical protein